MSKTLDIVIVTIAVCILYCRAVPVEYNNSENNNDTLCMGENEIFGFCAICQPTCETYFTERFTCMMMDCPYGCRCADGYVRNSTIGNSDKGACIKPEECSIEFKYLPKTTEIPTTESDDGDWTTIVTSNETTDVPVDPTTTTLIPEST